MHEVAGVHQNASEGYIYIYALPAPFGGKNLFGERWTVPRVHTSSHGTWPARKSRCSRDAVGCRYGCQRYSENVHRAVAFSLAASHTRIRLACANADMPEVSRPRHASESRLGRLGGHPPPVSFGLRNRRPKDVPRRAGSCAAPVIS